METHVNELNRNRIMAQSSTEDQLMEVFFSQDTGTTAAIEHEKATEPTPQEEKDLDTNDTEVSKVASIAKLEAELASLKLKLRLYEEPPDFDLNEYTIVVNGVQKAKSNALGVGGHVRYCISVKNPKSKNSITVFRRFSDWVWLSEMLEREIQHCLLPMRPPKKIGLLSGNNDAAFVDLRMFQLHAYTQCLSTHPTVRNNQYFRKFLYLPTEQWEDLVETVNLAASTKKSRSDISQNLWKGFEQTSKSILGSFGYNKSKAATATIVSSSNKSMRKFNDTYTSFAIVHVRPSPDLEETSVLRSVVLEDATSSILELMRSMKRKNEAGQKLASDLERLSMDEGTQVGPEMFSVLSNFSSALRKSLEAADSCVAAMRGGDSASDTGVTLAETLQQHTLTTQGLDNFQKCVCETLEEEVDVLEEVSIPELVRAEKSRRKDLSRCLESFAQQQIDLARARIAGYEDLLVSLQANLIEF